MPVATAGVESDAYMAELLQSMPVSVAHDATVKPALDAADVPAGPVRTLDAAFADPGVAAREMVVAVDHPTIGEVRLPGIPYKLSATPGSVRRAPPLLGEHTDEVLGELGFAADEVATLRDGGAI